MTNQKGKVAGGDSQPPVSHAVSLENRRPMTTLDTFKVQLVSEKGDYYAKIVNYFGGDKDRANKFMSTVVFSVQKNPKLLEADRESLLNAAMACAEFELYPSNVAGEAFIIPYKGKAQFQLGYQGIITLFYRAGITLRAEVVRKNDKFVYEAGLVPKLEHIPDAFATIEARGEPIGSYAIATLPDGRTYYKAMGAEEILGFRKFSQSYGAGSEYSPWLPKNDPELWMWKKTVIKQLAKTIPKTEKIQAAIGKDDEESTIAERKNVLDAGGIAVPRADHSAELPPVEMGACGKHPASMTDNEGDCQGCVAEALDKDDIT